MSEVISSENLEIAFHHIKKSRKNDSPNSDIWHLSRNWKKVKREIQEKLLAGNYLFEPVQVFRSKNGYLTRYTAQDAVVLKALANVLSPRIGEDLGKDCCHLKGHGGLKGGIRQVHEAINHYRFLLKSDVASFYDSMDHEQAILSLQKVIQDKRIIDLFRQYLNRLEIEDGEYRLIDRGIPKGCPLSPLVGAMILKSLDATKIEGCCYIRYMEDWVFLTKTKKVLRRLIKKMHQVTHRLKFKLARDKTFIGKVAKGFDFLGYRFGTQGIIGLADKTIHNFKSRIAVL